MKQKRSKVQTKHQKTVAKETQGWNLIRVGVGVATLVLALVFAFPEMNQFVLHFVEQLAQVKRSEPSAEQVGSSENIQPTAVPSAPKQEHKLAPEIANFDPTYQKTLATKKIFFQGRRIAPVELLAQSNVSSDTRVYLFEDFLSAEECDGLRAAHDKHIKLASNSPPLLCFESVDTLRRHLSQVNQTHFKLDPTIFTAGSYCLNSTFSSQVADMLSYNWSYSTAFYPGESPFSSKMAALIQETTGLKKENGGKFQITSYPLNIGYKRHTDCRGDDDDLRDRMATVLVYLDDVESGGETDFPELGIKVKPRKGQALVWNNMDPDGKCIPSSIHQANKVTNGRKYIIQRWYYYKSFWSLGSRAQPPPLPERTADQALVLCDEFKHGSCRWYDEWLPDVMVEYRTRSATLI